MAKKIPKKATILDKADNRDIFLVSKDGKRITVKLPEGCPGRFLLVMRPEGTAASILGAENQPALLFLLYASLQMGMLVGLEKVDKELYAFCTAMRNQMREMWPQVFEEETRH